MISAFPLIFEVLVIKMVLCEGCEDKFRGILLLYLWFVGYEGCEGKVVDLDT